MISIFLYYVKISLLSIPVIHMIVIKLQLMKRVCLGEVGRGAYQQHADSESVWQRVVRGQSVQTEDRRGVLSGQEGSCNTSWLLWCGECL